MLIVNNDGEYEYEADTKTPKTSDHPVFEARIDLALGVGTWLYAPEEGHGLARYQQGPQTSARMDQLQKELQLYLAKYGPEVKSLVGARGELKLGLEVADGDVNGNL